MAKLLMKAWSPSFWGMPMLLLGAQSGPLRPSEPVTRTATRATSAYSGTVLPEWLGKSWAQGSATSMAAPG